MVFYDGDAYVIEERACGIFSYRPTGFCHALILIC